MQNLIELKEKIDVLKLMTKRLLQCIAALLTTCSLTAVSAEFEEEELRWFEIEVIIFKPTNQQGLFDESWSDDIQIEKPENLVDFLQPYQEISNADGETLYDKSIPPEDSDNASLLHGEAADDTLINNPEPKTTQTPESNSLDSIDPLADGQIAETTDSLGETSLSEGTSFIEEEQPFVLLDKELLQLNDEAKSLSRHPEYQVLFHQAWRQPVLGSKEAERIRIAGGQDFSALFEYDGNKIIAKTEPSQDPLDPEQSTQLNPLSTTAGDDNLPQFQEFGNNETATASTITPVGETEVILDQQSQSAQPNDGQIINTVDEQVGLEEQAGDALNSQLVALPWVPELDGDIKIYLGRYLHIRTNLYLRRPDKEEVEVIDLNMLNDDLLTGLIYGQDSIAIENYNLTTPTTQSQFELDINNNLQLDNDPQSIGLTSDEPSNSVFDTNENSQFSWEINDNFLETESEKMYIERLFNYPLKQSRRVRSGELHFFDHPLVGVLIMIRPYELNKELTEDDGILPPSL